MRPGIALFLRLKHPFVINGNQKGKEIPLKSTRTTLISIQRINASGIFTSPLTLIDISQKKPNSVTKYTNRLKGSLYPLNPNNEHSEFSEQRHYPAYSGALCSYNLYS